MFIRRILRIALSPRRPHLDLETTQAKFSRCMEEGRKKLAEQGEQLKRLGNANGTSSQHGLVDG